MSRAPAAKRRRLSPPEIDDESATRAFAQNASQWNLEEAYEQRARQRTKAPKSDRLPVKTQDGTIEHIQRDEPETPQNGDDNEDEDSGLNSMLDEDDVRSDILSTTEPEKTVNEQVLAAQEDLARIAGMLSEDPEENIAQLKGLSAIADSKIPTIRKLAMVAQVAVFKDIIPGYRIRPLTDEDQKAKLSRDVKRLRTFEQTLVGCYRDFVTGLGRTIKAGSKNPTPAQISIANTAISCACALLDSVAHFNFRSELLNTIVTRLASRRVDKDQAKCRQALETLFENDEEGNSSLEAVTLLTKALKAKDYNVHESVFNTFLHLRLLSEYSFRASTERVDKDEEAPTNSKFKKKQREFRTKRERKMLKERKVVEKEMKEADATISHEEREKNQSEMLKLVFVAYFRVLKMRKQNLMGAVLEGLARYAHLINQDFFGDILESLRDLIAGQDVVLDDEDEEPEEQEDVRDRSRETLLCIVTAFSLLQGQDVHKSASSLHLDLSFFTKRLYGTVFPMAFDPNIEASKQLASTTENKKINVQTPALLLIRSLGALLLPPQSIRSVPPTLVAAFTKRLLTAAVHLPEKSAQAVLALVKQVVKIHGTKINALWYTEERRGDGVFDMERDDYESANPFATTAWEGELLKLHYSHKVRDGIKEIADGVKSQRS